MANYFPVDAWSLKQYGIEKWRSEFFWPVHNQEFETLFHEIEHLYLGIASNSSPDVRDSLWTLYHEGVTGVATLFHALIVIERLQQQGLTVSYHPSSWYYKTIIENKTFNTLTGRKLPKVFSSKEQMRGRLRSWRENLKYRGFDIGFYLNHARKPHYLAIEWRDQKENFIAFAASQGQEIKIVHWFQLMPSSLPDIKELVNDAQAISAFVTGLDAIAKKYDLQDYDRYINGIKEYLLYSVRYMAAYTEQITQTLKKRNPTSILVQGLGGLSLRSLCAAGRRAGHEIVGFPHGNNIGFFKYYVHILLSMVDGFVVPTEGAADLFSLSTQRLLHPYGKDVNISVAESDEYKKTKQLTRKNKLPSSIKKVMFVEFLLGQWWYVGKDAAFWPYQLDLTLRIAEVMGYSGIRAILKRHPDRLEESEGIYDDYFDQLLTTPFEEVYDTTDAYLFTTLRSTTFGFALLTNKPIIIFEHTLEDVWEPARELLRKRCRVVPSWVAEDGRLMFDEQALVAALRDPPNEPNDEFIERYMLS